MPTITKQLFTPVAFFHTPKTMEELQDMIKELSTAEERKTATMFLCFTFNFCSHAVQQELDRLEEETIIEDKLEDEEGEE